MLTFRQRQILQTIVEEYAHAPVPVSSESVAQKMPLAVSPATVRNEISDLEEEGYVTRHHPSAGSAPSDKGYRAYLEFLGEVPDPSRQVQRHIRHKLQHVHMDMEAWSRMAAQVLSGLVQALAVCTLPKAVETRWRHLDLVQVQEFLVLLIVVLQESRLKQQLVPLKEPVTQDQLTQISNKLNANFSSLSRREIRTKNVELTPLEGALTEVALDMLKQGQEEKAPPYYIDGLRHMFSYPELEFRFRAMEIAELLENPQLIGSLLEEAPDTGEVRITIGKENKAEPLRSFSVVYAQYGVPSEAAGMVGVIGPTRIEYANAISNVRYLSYVMSDMVGMVQGKSH